MFGVRELLNMMLLKKNVLFLFNTRFECDLFKCVSFDLIGEDTNHMLIMGYCIFLFTLKYSNYTKVYFSFFRVNKIISVLS